jgi:Na+/phosphate symporter
LATQKLSALKKAKKQVVKLTDEVEDLRDNIFFFIKNLDESSVEASGFYINILGYLQDITQSLELISKISYKHVNNNHKKLKFNQVKELREIYDKLEVLFLDTQNAFESGSFEEIGKILNEKKEVYDLVKEKIKSQVNRTRSEVSNPKNTTLYFSILLETKDLINSIMNLLDEYHAAHDSSVEPAMIANDQKKSDK